MNRDAPVASALQMTSTPVLVTLVFVLLLVAASFFLVKTERPQAEFAAEPMTATSPVRDQTPQGW